MALRLTDVHISFGSGRHLRRVLRGVTATLEAGKVTAIVGPNGTGKSTLVRTALGLLAPEEGRVELGGVDVGSVRGHDRARRLVYVPQRSDAAFSFSVRDVVGMGRYAAGEGLGEEGRDAVHRALLQVELADRAGDAVGELSIGQQQRVTLARALVQAELALGARKRDGREVALLADEPVSAMDPRHALVALGILRSVAREGAVVGVVLHDLTLAARIADRALVLGEDGGEGPQRIVEGSADEILRPEVLGPVMGLDLARVEVEGGGVLIGPAGHERETGSRTIRPSTM